MAASSAAIGPVQASPWGEFPTLRTTYDSEQGVLTYYLDPTPRPCFTRQALKDIRALQFNVRKVVERDLHVLGTSSIKYLVAASGSPDGTHFGGDLEFFLEVIRAGDRQGLLEYGHLGIEVLYENLTNLSAGVTTIAEIRGSTLGAGFEAALSCDVIVADKTAKLGFPEVLFNMFPGMGAYSFLSRRLSPAQAEKMIMSGRMYSADELCEAGIIDVVADEGGSHEAVLRYIRTADRKTNTKNALLKIRSLVNPVTREELDTIVDLWIDTAFRLNDYNVQMMERLLKAQNRRLAGPRVVNA